MTHLVRSIALTVGAASVVAAPALLGLPAAQAAAPTCFGKPATIIGTAGPDTLSAPVGAVVWAGGGADFIDVHGGYACGGPGDDYIDGYARNDHIDGGRGSDALRGDESARTGADVILGGPGADILTDFQDSDYPDQDTGMDILRGGGGDDVLRSWNGTDKLYGDTGHDTLLDWTRMTTYLYGGAGNDTFSTYHDNSGSNPLEPDYIFGGLGWDTAILDQEFEAADVWSPSTERVIVECHGGC